MATQTTRTRKAKKEVDKAEEFIEAAVTKAKRGEWPCTAEEIVAERAKGISWRQVAINLNLGSPNRARTAYTALTGVPHYEAAGTVRRAARGSVPGRKSTAPKWDDDTDQGEIEERLNGTWVEESGEPGTKNYVPGHWTGSEIVVKRTIGDQEFLHEVSVAYVTEFTYGSKGDQPLQVFVIEKETRNCRAFFVSAIQQVR